MDHRSITRHWLAPSRTAQTPRPPVEAHRLRHVRQAARPSGQLSVTEEQAAAMITHPVAAPQRRLPAAGCRGTGCVPRPLRRWEQLHELLNVEGCPMLSPDQSQTVIMTSTCSPSGSRSRRDVTSPGSGRSTGPTAERPTAAELARAQRCGKTAVPKSPPHQESPDKPALSV
jgi:hypothetical protein